jgi:hypothetical protein
LIAKIAPTEYYILIVESIERYRVNASLEQGYEAIVPNSSSVEVGLTLPDGRFENAITYRHPTYTLRPDAEPTQPLTRALVGKHIGRTLKNLSQGVAVVPVSPALRRDPSYRGSFRQEAERYLRYLEEHEPLRFRYAQQAVALFGEPQRDINELDAVFAVPAGADETHRISHSLANYAAQQDATTEAYISINTNGKKAVSATKQQHLQKRLNEVAAQAKRAADFDVRCMAGAYLGELPNMGTIRADLWDALLLDAYQRGRQKDLVVISNDIDGKTINNRYAAGFVDAFERAEQRPDFAGADLYWDIPQEVPPDSPLYNVLTFHPYLMAERNLLEGHSRTWDGNSSFSLTSFAAIGGYDRSRRIGETKELSKALYTARKDTYVDTVAEEPILFSDSRRQLRAAAYDMSPLQAWNQDNIGFAVNEHWRNRPANLKKAMGFAALSADRWVQQAMDVTLANFSPQQTAHIYTTARELFGFDVRRPDDI